MYFDIERMEKALGGDSIELPVGLTQEGMCKFIESAGKCDLKNSDYQLAFSALGILLHSYLSDPASGHLRFGQWFCNNYIKSPWPELYYQKDEKKAKKMIGQWLDDHCYIRHIPDKVI